MKKDGSSLKTKEGGLTEEKDISKGVQLEERMMMVRCEGVSMTEGTTVRSRSVS